jgi:hypothetical protein
VKEKYIWNYDIKIKTKEGTFDYEDKPLDMLEPILKEHPEYEEVQVKHKVLTKKPPTKSVKFVSNK